MKNKILFKLSFLTILIICCCFTISRVASAEELITKIHKISTAGVGEEIGTITFTDSNERLLVAVRLKKLAPGEHGMHIHENPSCDPADKDGKITAGQKAGPHYDPKKTAMHKGPSGGGHVGDLPKIIFDKNEESKSLLFVEGLKVTDIKGRSVIIHEGGDNYSDEPKPLGGGGIRIACGVLEHDASALAKITP